MKGLYTFVFALLALLASAQHDISGIVSNYKGEPLADVAVQLTGTERSTLTDVEGKYQFSSVEEGAYTLVFSYVGLATQEKVAKITWNDITVDVTLVSDNVLEEILVSSLRVEDEDPFTYSNISKEEINQRNLGQDIPVLLKYMPSVTTSSDAGAGVGYTYMRLRGSDASRINVTINGIPYNDAESQGTFWVDIPDMASSTQNIQVQRGVGTSTNGSSAFGGSLNILTDAYSDVPFAEVNSSMGSFNTKKNTFKFSTGLLQDHFEISGRYSDIYSDGYVDRAYADMKGYNLQGTYTDDERLIKVLTFGGEEKTYQAWYGLTQEELDEDRTQNPYTYDNEIDNYRQDHYQLHWHETLTDKWTSKIGLNYTKGKGYFEQKKEGESPSDFANIIAGNADGVADVIVRRWLDNDFYVANVTGHYDGAYDLDLGGSYSEYLGDHYGEVIWASAFAEGKNIRDRYYESDSKKTDLSAFAKATFSLGSKADLYVDVQGRNVGYTTSGLTSDRTDIAVDTSFIFFNPKVGFSYQASPKARIYTSYARAKREPNRNDFKNGVTNHESMDNVELGVRYADKLFSFNANGYLMYYRNQLVLTGQLNDVGAPIRTTSGKSYRAGIELDATYQPTKLFSTSGNLTLSSNKNIDFVRQFNGSVENLGSSDISFSPSVILGNVLTLTPVEGMNISLWTKYVGSQYMSNTESAASKLDGYITNDFTFGYTYKPRTIFKEIGFNIMLNNIFNVAYVDRGYYYTYDDTWSDPDKVMTIEGTGYYPQARFNFLAGVNIKF